MKLTGIQVTQNLNTKKKVSEDNNLYVTDLPYSYIMITGNNLETGFSYIYNILIKFWGWNDPCEATELHFSLDNVYTYVNVVYMSTEIETPYFFSLDHSLYEYTCD